MGFDGFNAMMGGFGMFETFISLIFGAVAVIIIFSLAKGVSQWSSNNKQPILNVASQIVSKRTHVSHRHDTNDGHFHNATSTTYYITFEVESGERMEFKVDGREFGHLAEGDHGTLKYQGTRYLGYERLPRHVSGRQSSAGKRRSMS